jgi:hypothetical protein
MLCMAWRGRSGCWMAGGLACTALLVCALAGAAESGPDAKHKADVGPPPTIRIDVTSLGFIPPSRFYLSARMSSVTLDFIDKDHLLFTFRKSGLVPRLPDEPKDDEDRIICAVVLDAGNGKVVERAEWRMHDRQRYLWAIGDGKFLVRQRNALYLTDSHLELRPYMQFNTNLQSIEIAPDHNLMAVEFEKFDRPAADDDAQTKPKPTLDDDLLGTQPRRKSTQILIVRPMDLTVVARSEAHHAVSVPLLNTGMIQVLEGKRPDLWEVQNRPFGGEPAILGEVKSACTPMVQALSKSAVMTVGCYGGTSDRAVTVMSAEGKLLWQDRWQPRYIWPTFEFAENGTRFAYGSLQLNHTIGTMDPFGDEDVQGQMVGVFDTETGKLQLVKNATPALSAGHNYALTADGSRFAILRDGALEVYDLPPAPPASAPVPAPNVAAK